MACRPDCDACANGATYGHQSADGGRAPGPVWKRCPLGFDNCAMCAAGFAHRVAYAPPEPERLVADPLALGGVRFAGEPVTFATGVQEPSRLAASGPPPGKRPRAPGEPCCDALAPGGAGHCACDPRWTSLAPAAPPARLVLGVRSPGDWADETD